MADSQVVALLATVVCCLVSCCSLLQFGQELVHSSSEATIPAAGIARLDLSTIQCSLWLVGDSSSPDVGSNNSIQFIV